ncbi:MAG: hypothetical protein ACREFX_08760 [Opitutaceae bacterium]
MKIPHVILGLALAAGAAALDARASAYRHFTAAVYIPVETVESFKDPAVLERQWARISSQVGVDKVYIESYRSRVIADGALLDRVKAFFLARGVKVAGGMALSSGDYRGQFLSFCYTDPRDRACVAKVSAFTARHFDEIILDDFFFYNTKRPSDIAAKGRRSWTDFRLAAMDEAAADLVLKPMREANPRVRVIIKYPNWYEHYQGDGYDLAVEPRLFDGIFTGTETRDPVINDQNLTQYQSYEDFRFLENASPGRNGGGWVDPFGIRYVDRYAEQLWDTLLAKAPEMMLFSWPNLMQPVVEGARPWSAEETSFDWGKFIDGYRAHPTPGYAEPSLARAAGYSLDEMDAVLGRLGRPVGLASYKPYQSVGEDYLQNYLGMVGIPIELRPDFPANAPMVLLTESAAADPNLLAEIKARLLAGKSVAITSGLLRALEPRGIQDIAEIRDSGTVVPAGACYGAFGSGEGSILGKVAAGAPVLIPALRFITNDAWPLIRTVAGSNGYPLLLMDHYGGGSLLVLAIPDNFSDLYRLPPGALTALRRYLTPGLPVHLEGPSQVALFAYDNGAFVVESYRDTPCRMTLALGTDVRGVRDLATGAALRELPPQPHPSSLHTWSRPEKRRRFGVDIPPHSYRAFMIDSGSP